MFTCLLTDERTNKQVEIIMHPPTSLVWYMHKNALKDCCRLTITMVLRSFGLVFKGLRTCFTLQSCAVVHDDQKSPCFFLSIWLYCSELGSYLAGDWPSRSASVLNWMWHYSLVMVDTILLNIESVPYWKKKKTSLCRMWSEACSTARRSNRLDHWNHIGKMAAIAGRRYTT